MLPWKLLLRGFELDGERVSLVSMQGIFKPRRREAWPDPARLARRYEAFRKGAA